MLSFGFMFSMKVSKLRRDLNVALKVFHLINETCLFNNVSTFLCLNPIRPLVGVDNVDS